MHLWSSNHSHFKCQLYCGNYGGFDFPAASSTVFGTDSCRNSAFGGSATASTYYDLQYFGTNTFALYTGADVLAGAGYFGDYGKSTGTLQVNLQIGTEGPIRPGLVVGNFNTGFLSNGAGGNSSIVATPNYFGNPFTVGYTFPRTIQLGTPISFTITDVVSGSAGLGDEAAGGGPGASQMLSFFEADGTTPVAIADIPEPRWTLAAGLLSAALLIAIQLRARSSRAVQK